MLYETKIEQRTASLLREEVSMACLCIAISVLVLRTKVLHATASHSGHCPGQENHNVFFTLHDGVGLVFLMSK